MKRVLNITFVGIWAIWIGGAVIGFISVGTGPKDIAALPLKSLQQGAALLPKANAASVATGQATSLQAKAPLASPPVIAREVRDCTAVTPIEKSAGTACDTHTPAAPSMAPAVFHASGDK